MISKYKNHADQVEAWIRPATKDLTPEQLVLLFEQTFAVLWKWARISISEVMLTAVFNRVLLNCTEFHPLLSKLNLQQTGIVFDELHKSDPNLDESHLIEAFQSMITEFISILGGLTNEVITPALYSELSKIKLEPKLKVLPRTGEKS